MVNVTSESPQRQRLRTVVEALLLHDVTTLIRPELGSQLSFAGLQGVFERVRESATATAEVLEYIPDRLIEVMLTTLEPWTQLLAGVVQLDPVDERWKNVRQKCFEDIQRQAGNGEPARSITPVLALAKAIRLERQIEELQQMPEQWKTERERAIVEAQQAAGTIQSLLRTESERVAKVGVEKYAETFAKLASAHGRSARRWLIVTCIMLAATVALAFANVLVATPKRFFAPANATAAEWVQVALGKLILFSLLVTGVVAALRIFKAHRHNQVVNEHRASALSSFETFVASAAEPQTKDGVLLQATQSIFAPQPTGFTSSDTDGAPASQILEVYRASAKQGG